MCVKKVILTIQSISFFVKYRARQKHLLPFHNVNTEFKKLDVNNVF